MRSNIVSARIIGVALLVLFVAFVVWRQSRPLGRTVGCCCLPREEVLCLQFNGNGQSVTAGTTNGRITTWDIASSKEHSFTLPEFSDYTDAMALSPDGTKVAAWD